MKTLGSITLLVCLTGGGSFAVAQDNHGHDHDEHGDTQMQGVSARDGHGHESVDADEHAHGEGDEHGHAEAKEDDGHGHGHGEPASDAELSEAQRKTAGIETFTARRQTLGEAITAPGEVILNTYRTVKISPRTAAQVSKRHARLGDRVRTGQPLVSLSSVDMAEAQGALMEAHVELERAEALGRQVVSEKRYVAAQIAYQQAFAKASAYGMTQDQVETLLKTGDAAKATGEFVLLAIQGGTVITDDFVVGELIEPGRVLMTISDESRLWVEARLTPDDTARIAVGAPARIQVGNSWIHGAVSQTHHALDESTRTLAIQIEIPNDDDALHPGQFVTAVIESKQKRSGIAVPLAAVLRSADGDWQVFVEAAPGRFEPREVKVLSTVGDQLLIEGIAEGTTLVGEGAFFVQSEIAKSGFEVHNH